jgi:hypothetical protein
VGHAWLDIYLMDRSRKQRLEPMRDRLSGVIANPVTEKLAHGSKPKTQGVSVSDRWTWCDALYMAPPTLVRLFTATGDRKYLDFLDREFQFTYDHLYDPAEKLFFRDATFFEKKTPSGNKTFWSRGNGWVYGGLALMLEHLPKDHPKRGFYETLFKQMTTAILAAQQPDGLGRPSLLDPTQVPLGETSGSGFFVFGLAWDVNHGPSTAPNIGPPSRAAGPASSRAPNPTASSATSRPSAPPRRSSPSRSRIAARSPAPPRPEHDRLRSRTPLSHPVGLSPHSRRPLSTVREQSPRRNRTARPPRQQEHHRSRHPGPNRRDFDRRFLFPE